METTWTVFIGACAGAITAGISWVTFWLRWSDRETKTSDRINEVKTYAISASQEAAEAKLDIEKLQIINAAYQAAFNDFQLRVVGGYAEKGLLKEVETRVISAVEKVGRDTTNQIEQLTKRVDSIVSNRRSQT